MQVSRMAMREIGGKPVTGKPRLQFKFCVQVGIHKQCNGLQKATNKDVEVNNLGSVEHDGNKMWTSSPNASVEFVRLAAHSFS